MDDFAIGLMVRFAAPERESLRRVRDMGLRYCQLTAPTDDYLYGEAGKRNTRALQEALAEFGVGVTSLFLSFPDQDWNNWRETVGLVPVATRACRMARACRAADWGMELGIRQVASHIGAIPKPGTPEFDPFIRDLRPFVRLLGSNGQLLAYETGQESALTLQRAMEAVGEQNQAVNFDPANLLIYNQDAPADFLDLLGDRVVHVHCKDGRRPESEKSLGTETRLGEGDVDFPRLFATLYRRGYRGPLTIEREIPPGEELDRDTRNAVDYLRKLIEAEGK